MQWLVFRNDGATTAGQWAQDAAQYASKSGLLSVFDRGKEQRQQAFVKEILRQTMKVQTLWPPCLPLCRRQQELPCIMEQTFAGSPATLPCTTSTLGDSAASEASSVICCWVPRFLLTLPVPRIQGLAYIHSRNRLHQSLGPSSVVLNTTNYKGSRPLLARLQDLAFSVDVSDAALFGGATLADIWEKGTIDAQDPL